MGVFRRFLSDLDEAFRPLDWMDVRVLILTLGEIFTWTFIVTLHVEYASLLLELITQIPTWQSTAGGQSLIFACLWSLIIDRNSSVHCIYDYVKRTDGQQHLPNVPILLWA